MPHSSLWWYCGPANIPAGTRLYNCWETVQPRRTPVTLCVWLVARFSSLPSTPFILISFPSVLLTVLVIGKQGKPTAKSAIYHATTTTIHLSDWVSRERHFYAFTFHAPRLLIWAGVSNKGLAVVYKSPVLLGIFLRILQQSSFWKAFPSLAQERHG